jgi:hypothetical protein
MQLLEDAGVLIVLLEAADSRTAEARWNSDRDR